MSELTVLEPDCWKLVGLRDEEYGAIFKILASWNGCERWRLSSPMFEVALVDAALIAKTDTGTIYRLFINQELESTTIRTQFARLNAAGVDLAFCNSQLVLQYFS